MARRRRRYSRTARQQAQLRRAQYISAQKRRRRKVMVRRAGYAAAGFGALFVTKQLNRYAGDPRQIGRDYRDLKKLGNNAKAKSRKTAQKLRTKKAVYKMKHSKSEQLRLW